MAIQVVNKITVVGAGFTGALLHLCLLKKNLVMLFYSIFRNWKTRQRVKRLNAGSKSGSRL